MKSLSVIIFYIATVCGVFAYPSAVTSPSTSQQKGIEQKTDEWNKGLTSYPSFFADLNVPSNQRGFVSHSKSKSNGKINLIDKDAPLVGIAPQSESVSSSTTISTISKENQAKKNQKESASASGGTSTKKSAFVPQSLVDIQDNGCQPGFDRDPNGECQKIEN